MAETWLAAAARVKEELPKNDQKYRQAS